MTNKEFKKIREKLELTQIELAEKLFLTQTQVSRIELGKSAITKRVKYQIRVIENELS